MFKYVYMHGPVSRGPPTPRYGTLPVCTCGWVLLLLLLLLLLSSLHVLLFGLRTATDDSLARTSRAETTTVY